MTDGEDQNWVRIGDATSVADEAAAEFVFEGQVLAVFRHAGRLYALDGMCAHQGGPIAKGAVANGCVTCPWHAWQYELASGNQTIHNQKLLETYRIKEDQGGLWIAHPASSQAAP